MKKHLLLFCLLSTCLSLNAQVGWKCGTPPYKMPEHRQAPVKNIVASRSDTDTLYIPVTINILGTDNGTGYIQAYRVLEALCQLQTDFEKHSFRFYVEGEFNYLNSSAFYNMSSTYIWSDTMLQFITDHNAPNTMNLYIVQSAQGSAFVPILPWDYDNSTYPPTINNSFRHALIIPKSWLGTDDHTFAHEAGHYFGLWHTFFGWEGTDYQDYVGLPAPDTIKWSGTVLGNPFSLAFPVERTDSTNCLTAGDLICDTPPDYLSIGFTCNSDKQSPIVQTDPTGAPFRSDGTLYMSYSNNACQNRFSPDQATWMRDVAQGPRDYLLFNQTPPAPFSPSNWQLLYPLNFDTIPLTDSVTLEWELIPEADFYVLELGRLVGANIHVPILNSGLLENNNFKVKINPGFRYYWNVTAFNKYYPCDGLRDTSFFTVSTSVRNLEAELETLKLYPNPSVGQVYWRLPEGVTQTEGTTVQVFDIQGQLLHCEISNKRSLDLQGFPAGIYAVKVSTRDRVFSGKIVKQ
ncbi:MAG: zinc-dependent metalloprotease [Saprospiraceae bacterium]|nr:zinc-dependent metalloprotease [Saprospiraceae bacterium]